MNAFASECSSGFESGWTLYLEHSFPNGSHRDTRFVDGNGDFYDEHREKRVKDEDAAEEDLSMVSDASSGPPHFPDEEAHFNEDNGCFYPPSKTAKLSKSGKKRQKVKENHEDHHLPSFLDDTASSPVFDFSMNNNSATNNQQASTESVLDFSQGFSATYFEERSSFQDHFGFFQPSLSENELQNNLQWFGGKGMGMR
ncbi:hypothetical protein L6164_035792 [Bauhinia variegata]|uniref:Uncharacterized protein n=1 Tax=Bauhinia variegata TaxID=167791 RepID=A0ACB9KF46_BAUVA|nr:hypothetical protein L6164_035792 [Bauhinia variegata]